MQLSSDYKDILRIFNEHKVRYLVVGAYAVSYYTEPRFTKDLDIWIEPAEKNAQNVFDALKVFGVPLKGISSDDFTNKKLVYQIGVAPIRVDIITGLTGLNFANAWRNKKRVKYGNTTMNMIGIEELISSKKGIKRDQDKLDLKKLKRIKRRRSSVG